MTEHFVETRLFDVEDLALERQNRLILSIAPLLRRTAGRITLNDVDLRQCRVLFLAIRQFARQCRAAESTLADDLACLAGRFAGPCRVNGLTDDLFRHSRILLKELSELLVQE